MSKNRKQTFLKYVQFWGFKLPISSKRRKTFMSSPPVKAPTSDKEIV